MENKAATARISANITRSALPLAEMALVVADVAGGMKEAEAREAEATTERSWSARASRRRRDGTVRRCVTVRDLREVAEIGRPLGVDWENRRRMPPVRTRLKLFRRYLGGTAVHLLAGGGCGKSIKLGKSDLL